MILGGQKRVADQIAAIRAVQARTPAGAPEPPKSEAEIDHEMLLEQQAEERAFDRRFGGSLGGAA